MKHFHPAPMLSAIAALSLCATPSWASEPAPNEPSNAAEAGPQAEVENTPPQPGRFLLHLNVGVNLYTYIAPTSAAATVNMTPADHVLMAEQIGIGYWLHPHLRLQLTVQVGEMITGVPATGNAFTFLGAIPWVVYTQGPFFVGAGVVVAARSYGAWRTDVGVFTAVGAGFPVGGGFTLGAALQVPFMFLQRFSVAFTPALFVARRF